jgi:hypothetical protein
MFHSRKVVLVPPPYPGKILEAPLGLLSLAGSIRQAGFEPRIVDGASILITGQPLSTNWREIQIGAFN